MRDRAEVTPIEVGREDRFAIEVGPGHHLPERSDDAAAAARHDGAGIVPERRVVVGRIIRAARELVGRQDEAAPLERDVPHRRQPGVARIGGRRAVDFHALRIHGRTQQRHVVLPADDGADAADVGVDHRQGGAVAESPYQAFAGGGHELAVLAEIAAVGTKKKRRAVQRPAVAFDDADDQVHPVRARHPRQPIDRRAGDVDRTLPVAAELLAAGIGARTDDGAKVQPARIGRDERLGKQRQPRAAPAGVRHQIGGLLQRAADVERHRRGLHDRHRHPLARVITASPHVCIFCKGDCPLYCISSASGSFCTATTDPPHCVAVDAACL